MSLKLGDMSVVTYEFCFFFFFQAEDGIRDHCVTGVQTCALPIYALQINEVTTPISHHEKYNEINDLYLIER